LLVEGMNWPSPELATKKVESGKTRSGRFTWNRRKCQSSLVKVLWSEVAEREAIPFFSPKRCVWHSKPHGNKWPIENLRVTYEDFHEETIRFCL
jgi:hypothetical protein